MDKEVFIVQGYRTPFRKFNTDLADEDPVQLGVSPCRAIFSSTNAKPSDVDEVVFGCCNQPATTIGNVARSIGVRSGVPVSVPAVTVHRNCASGFEAITYAYDKAQAGKGNIFLVGGVESMSQAPLLFSRDAAKKFTNLARSKTLSSKMSSISKFRPGDFSPQVSLKLGLTDPLCDMNMGQTAELLAREHNISREDQDSFAESSHLKALANNFTDEICPYYLRNDDCIKSFNGNHIVDDNGPRNDAFRDKLAKLRTVFDKQGTVTAGNSSQVTDGGAALLLMTKEGLDKTGCAPIARLVDYAYAGCDPKRMGLGPVHAIEKLNRSVNDADLVEINEAFAAQVLSVLKHYPDLDTNKVNVKGGAIALGHPLAASGVRLVLTLIRSLHKRQLTKGLASLCVGGGQGGAIWLESM